MDQLRVLVIDDSATIRALIEQIVNGEPGCRVIGAAPDAMRAGELLADLEPNVITLDLSMPGIDGIAFLDQIQQRRHAPIVVISSSTTQGSIEAKTALEHGAAACFDKATVIRNADGLLRMLKRVVRQHRRKAA